MCKFFEKISIFLMICLTPPCLFKFYSEFSKSFLKILLTSYRLCAIIANASGCGAVGSALPWGGRGRWFKSSHSDQIKPKTVRFRLYFCIFGVKSSVFPPLSHLQKFRKFFDHMFDHSWSKGKSFGCFCSGGSAHIKSNNSKGSRRYSLREPFSLFPAYQFLVAPYNDLPADLVALFADSFQFQNHFNQEFFFTQLHESRFIDFRINCRSFFQPIKHKRCPSIFDDFVFDS